MVFDETVKMLRKVRGADSVKVRVRAENGSLTVEPPRRVFRVEGSVKPTELKFSEQVLSLEADYGNLKLRALIAGQLE